MTCLTLLVFSKLVLVQRLQRLKKKILQKNCLVQKTDFSRKVREIENKLPTRFFRLDLIKRQPLTQKKVTLEVE